MSFLKGITSVAASPFTLVEKTGEALGETADNFKSDDPIDLAKGITKLASCGLSAVPEGAVKTCKKISDDFDE
jgi:hypothetical protein